MVVVIATRHFNHPVKFKSVKACDAGSDITFFSAYFCNTKNIVKIRAN